MNNIQGTILEKIEEQKVILEDLRKQYHELIKDDKSEILKSKYLGKYFLCNKNINWQIYIFVNSLKDARLQCYEFIILNYDEKDGGVSVQCDSNKDFSTHYIMENFDEHDIDECVEITKGEYFKKHDEFLKVLAENSSNIKE